MSFFSVVLLVLVLFTWFTWYVRNNPLLWVVTVMSWVLVVPYAKAQIWAFLAQALSTLTA